MTTKAKGTSVRQKLINLSVDLGVPYQNLETAFILERLVARLTADTELQKHLVFKGGFVGLKVYSSSRYTVDVDALVVKADVDSVLESARHIAETDLDDGVWFLSRNRWIWQPKANTAESDRPIVPGSVKS